jgi:hypothetical protein
MQDKFNTYIDMKGIKEGGNIFPNFNSNTVPEALRNFTKTVLGKTITASTLRKAYHHIFLGELHKEKAEIDEEIKKTTDRMGHSINTATYWYSKYKKVDSTLV